MSGAALLLLAVGGEAAFYVRDDGAFPHLNFYLPDPDLGVRLEPRAEMRLSFGGNPVTTVRTNSRGFRGGEWAPGAGGIVVVGDSQVFGLGVEEEQAAYEAQLSAPEKARRRQESLLLSATWVLDLRGDDDLLLQAAVREAHPGDIIWDEQGESERSVKLTASLLKRGVALRKDLPAKMRAWAEAHPGEQASHDILKILTAMELPPAPEIPPAPGRESVLAPQIEAFAALCRRYGARPVLVTLPLDVVVDRQEWAKYGEDPAQMPDMAETEVLLLEAREVAARLGITPVDPMAHLRAAEPGAFLYGDIHLSPKGQAALAAAIREQAFR